VNALRERQKRNLMATLLLSQGVPMISGGDEIGRTQGGNNNAYCQDNPISWTHWDLTHEQREFLEFTGRLVAIRREHPVLRRRRFFRGRAVRGAEVKDIAWLDPGGSEMTDDSWNVGFVRCLGVRLEGNAIDEVDERGQPIVGDSLLVLLNAHHDRIDFTLPAEGEDDRWVRLIDTSDTHASGETFEGQVRYPLEGRSLVLFKLVDLTRQPGVRPTAMAVEDAWLPRLAAPAWAEAQTDVPRPATRPMRVRKIEGPEVTPEPDAAPRGVEPEAQPVTEEDES
jgi:glycogen operon protein